jgi:cell wall-associated NlpC family hydrolase
MKAGPTVRGALAAAALLVMTSCGSLATPKSPETTAAPPRPLPAFLADSVAAIRADYAPDRRVARFDVEGAWSGDRLVVTGATDQPAAMERLGRALAGRGVAWDDRVRRLPDAAGGPLWALVNNSVANLRSEPRHPAELATQVPMGTPLRVLDREGGWLLVQAPDGYIAWVDAGGVRGVTESELEAHRTAAKVIYLGATGVARSAPRPDARPVADLVAGALLVRVGEEGGYHRVAFPDGREGYVRDDEAASYAEWAASVRATEGSVVDAAVSLLGRPYLWGGTSPKGMDCSGFTKTAFLVNGLVLPRDASQQAFAGALVDDEGAFDALRPGDLLFFGRPATGSTPERVVHVGMWIGNGRFIHSSGRVRISGVDPADPLYDEYNVGRYLRTRRILGESFGVHRLADDALYPRDGRFAPAATAGPAARAGTR